MRHKTETLKGFRCEYDPFVDKQLVISYGAGEHVPGTAVVRIYSHEGFVVAADGLRRDRCGHEISKTQQKLFRVQEAGKSFAYALSGITYIEQGEKGLDLCLQAARVVELLSGKSYDNPYRYTMEFGRLLRKVLLQAQADGRLKEFPDFGKEGLIVAALFAGYYGGNPFMSRVPLFHKDQEIEPPTPDLKILRPSITNLEIAGSEKVHAALLNPNDVKFSRYRTKGWGKVMNESVLSLGESVEMARSYLEACAGPEGQELDPECTSIGGHIHIATIKPADGFKWIDPPAER